MNLTYFAALASERTEFRLVRERFPTELKGKVLAAVQFQIMGRFDALVDSIFERFRDRYFVSEQLFVEIEGDK
jgi:bromodomain adjacent to zinc finger domain protein 1A